MQSIDENERFLIYKISQKLFLIESPDSALSNKMRNQKYHIVRAVPKYNHKILETANALFSYVQNHRKFIYNSF